MRLFKKKNKFDTYKYYKKEWNDIQRLAIILAKEYGDCRFYLYSKHKEENVDPGGVASFVLSFIEHLMEDNEKLKQELKNK